jgi:hypothetical protein
MTRELFRQIFETKKGLITNLIKIHPVGVHLFHAGRTDGRRDMTMLIVAFRNFVNVPKN